MEDIKDIEGLEKLIGQLKAFHSEISQLARKSPNDALNAFKLRLINQTLGLANAVLEKDYQPFADFRAFEQDDVPSNSDVTVMIAQYLEEAERYRSAHVIWDKGHYVYKVGGQVTNVKAAIPTWSRK